MSRGRVWPIVGSSHASAIAPTTFRVGNAKRTVGDVRTLVSISAGIVKPATRTVAGDTQRTIDGTIDARLAVEGLAISAVESRTIDTAAESLAGAASQIGSVEASTDRVVIAVAKRPRSTHHVSRRSRDVTFKAGSVSTSTPTAARLSVTGATGGVF